MNLDEFAFFNEQLGAMLRDGIPLEGAMRQLASSMRRGRLRRQLEELEQRLAAGDDLVEAARAVNLPELYLQTLAVGRRSGNLPGVLLHVADYYRHASLLGMRLRGLLTYPTLVLLAMSGFSLFYFWFIWPEATATLEDMLGKELTPLDRALQYVPMVVPLVLLAGWGIFVLVKPLRRWLSWRVPPGRDGHLSRLAAMCHVLLAAGVPLSEVVSFMAALHRGTPAGKDFRTFEAMIGEGRADLAELMAEARYLPGFFRWILTLHRQDPAKGFQRAADFYERRAGFRTEVMLYVAMPLSVLFLGFLVMLQFGAMWRPMIKLIDTLGGG